MEKLKSIIEGAFNERANLSPHHVSFEIRNAIQETIDFLDQGKIRVAEKIDQTWHTHEWIKKAILLYFRIHQNEVMGAGFTQFFDKVPLKFREASHAELAELNVRIVPPATVRKGAYLAPNTILMPAYVNMGAYIDSGTLIDTWATVGSCAQIGKNVHLSGGAGIGGVLEPLQGNPTIIEDNCFIGARSEIVEGVIVETGSVISMGVFIGQSTRIYNRETGEIIYGRVPAGSVVVPGNLPSEDGKYSLYSAIIVKKVDEKTKNKISLNELLRI
ncbi:MAG: 2,3,4,5-tetrahydropyridine-2,6-dicarboxylate N-succinyltransferase [Gammaproteobacteria bacterium RIFCSPHIGHO2_12_FULL_38_14]|nr:MAG: 2,3,4,5-tetrahydropyridine-2,6-dicarboxylate N-succinyltransferase [Gammaproteobacteria bacterium RIFCSPHIGHO2_12_FULL_38_14]